MVTVLAACFFTIILFVISLFPIPFLLAKALPEFEGQIRNVGSGLVILLLLFFGYTKLSNRIQTTTFTKYVPYVGLLIVLLLLTHIIVFPVFSLIGIEVSGMVDFFMSEPLLTLTLVIGSLGMSQIKKYQPYVVVSMLSIILLEMAYYRVNPYAQRYWTHLLPFLIIPASFGLSHTLSWLQKQKMLKRHAGGMMLILLVLTQVVMTYGGVKNWQNGAWSRSSYEEKAGELVKERIHNPSTLILASFPESYYLLTGYSTHSISDTPPFIYLHESLDSEGIVIVQDMGMYDLFPTFSTFLDTSMQDKKRSSFRVNVLYRYADRSSPEKYPVTLYQTTVKELKERIQKTVNH